MKIFLSYASEDRDAAEKIYLNLVTDNHQVFFDLTDLPAGGDFGSRIRKAISESELFIFLISPDSVTEDAYTLTELRFAREMWRNPVGRILPVMLRETSYDSIPNYLKAVTALEPEGSIAPEVAGRVASWRFDDRRRLTKKVWKAVLGLLLAVLVLVPVGLLAFKPSFTPSPSSSSLVRTPRPTPVADARVYIHIVDEKQRPQAEVLRSELVKQGFIVMRIIRHDTGVGPNPQVIYWNQNDKDEAGTIAGVMQEMPGLGNVTAIDRSGNMAGEDVSRFYEVWLPD